MIVVKFGGHAMRDENGAFADAVVRASKEGKQIVIVHGGGPQIDAELKAQEIESNFIGGFRVTTKEIFDVVEHVLVKEVGPAVAASITKAGITAVAISGRTSEALIAKPLRKLVDGTPADLGLVGVVTGVNPTAILNALREHQIPVIAPVACDESFKGGLNVNADLAAAAIAGALNAEVLIIMTDVPGIYRTWPDQGSLIERIDAQELESMKGSFSEGMAPKVQACIDAILEGALAVRIIDGTDPLAFTQALAGHGGTLVTA